ncbi:MAG: glycosyltransferase family 2 protein [Clostridia bacterium]
MITISLCMIVKNEEKVLDRCLNSVKDFTDEIIIVDTGSTDDTKKIATKYTNKIYDFKWDDNFSKARNFSFSKATKDYQMWLDADDIVTDENIAKIIKLKNTLDKNIDIVTFKYNTNFDIYNNPILTSTRERLFKSKTKYLWIDPVHEYIQLNGNILNSDICIDHKKESNYTDRNLKIYENLIKKNIQLSPRGLYYFARELKDNNRYIEAIKYFNDFLDTNLGWVEDNISACYSLAICYKLIKDNNKILDSLFKSFTYDSPRAEIICEIGYYYLNNNEYIKAKNWFNISINLEKPDTIGFILNDYYTFIPHIELAVCYYNLNDIPNSIKHNNIAGSFKPNSDIFLNNKKILSELNY